MPAATTGKQQIVPEIRLLIAFPVQYIPFILPIDAAELESLRASLN